MFSHNRLSGIQPAFPASAYRFFTRFSKCKTWPTHVLEPGTSISCVVGITWGRVGADTGLSVVCVYGATFSLCQNTCFSYICTTQASSGARGVSSVKGGSAGEKISLRVKIKFGFLFSGENFSEISFLLKDISLFTLVLRSKR